MQRPQIRPSIQVEDYLAGELESEVRHEYVDGEVYAMVGASDRHGMIAGNLHSAFNLRLPDRCQVFMADMKVRIRVNERDLFYYPDVLVSCDPRDRDPYYRQHPCLVAEVLSPHTARHDRFEKALSYRQLECLEEYVLISQEYRLVEVFRRADRWQASACTEGEVVFRSIELAVSIDALYRRTGL